MGSLRCPLAEASRKVLSVRTLVVEHVTSALFAFLMALFVLLQPIILLLFGRAASSLEELLLSQWMDLVRWKRVI